MASALEDLVQLEAFLLEKDPAAAAAVVPRIRRAAAMLRRQPRIGRAEGPPGQGLRLLAVGPYGVRYRLDEECVVIAGVWHGKEARP